MFQRGIKIGNLFDNYLSYCSYKKSSLESGLLDLSKEMFIQPTTLLPLIMFYKKEKSKMKLKLPSDSGVATYIKIVTDSSSYFYSDGRSYLPIISLPKEKKSSLDILERLYQFTKEGKDYGGENTFKYLVGEMVDNIYQHSEFNNAMVMAQKYPRKKYADICFIDDGISINGSFKKKGLLLEEDYIAIEEAINGLSTKDKDRGTGLNTNFRIFTEGLNGEILIISGGGGVLYGKHSHIPYILKQENILDGTLINIRMPCPSQVNMYEYIR